MQRFAETEMDSAWQNLHCITKIESPKIRAMMFQHCLDEMHHADLFKTLQRKYVAEDLPTAHLERKSLFFPTKNNSAIVNFFANECIAEAAVCDEFQLYRRSAPYKDIKDVFFQLEKDENHHRAFTQDLFNKLEPSSARRNWLALTINLKLFYEAWCRLGNFIGEFFAYIILSIIYYFFGFFMGPKKE